MKTALKVFSKLALVAGISVALAFGAKEASACATCNPQPTACKTEVDPDLFCESYCINQAGCLGGTCRLALDECWCVE